ncbi:MAG: ATPase, T2SS/T4P/T4SS family [Elusimicrobiota bacterium]
MRLKPIKKRLGDILVEVGIISTDQLHSALEIQKRGGGKLGEILAQMGAINEEVMLAFIGKQCGASFVSLSEYGEIAQDVIKTIPESIARHQNLIPIERNDNVLTIAMADPFNIFAIDDIKVMTGYDVQVVIASEPEIKTAIKKYFSFPSVIDSGAKQPESHEEQINALLERALRLHATEIHFEPQTESVRIRFRIDGMLHEQAPISEQLKSGIAKKLKLLGGIDPEQSFTPAQGHSKIKIGDKDIHIKVSAIPTILGERLTLQILDPSLPGTDFSKLGFEPETFAMFRKNIESSNGMILLTGPINSGTTTTLYSTLNNLNRPDRDIITIENTVEYILPGLTQIQLNEEKLFDYPKALQHAIEHKPDIIMIGVLKDHETTEIAMSAAIAGHLVLSTLHSAGAVETITNLLNMGIEPYKISSALKTIISQRLMRMICANCKTSYKVARNVLQNMGLEPAGVDKSANEITLWRGKGCQSCNNTGYSGQIAVFEVVELDGTLRSLIIERASEAIISEAIEKKGILTLRGAAWRKIASGLSTIEEMMRLSKNYDHGTRGAQRC